MLSLLHVMHLEPLFLVFVEAFVDSTIAMDPSPSTSSAFSIRTMLDMVLNIQVAHGELLLDLLNEVVALQADLADARGSTPPAPPSDES